MGLHKLYKGRYLIALYDENDMLVDVGINPFDLNCAIRPHTLYENMCRERYSFFGYTIHLIDCLEIHEDIFKEEDELFLEQYAGFVGEVLDMDKKLEQKAKELGISKRTAYRWKAKGKLKGF
jgi:hypothetical protein